jgi:hypothetical protein
LELALGSSAAGPPEQAARITTQPKKNLAAWRGLVKFVIRILLIKKNSLRLGFSRKKSYFKSIFPIRIGSKK